MQLDKKVMARNEGTFSLVGNDMSLAVKKTYINLDDICFFFKQQRAALADMGEMGYYNKNSKNRERSTQK